MKLEVGSYFGYWKILEKLPKSKYRCECSCGKTQILRGYSLVSGSSSKCRTCADKERASKKVLPLKGKFGRLCPISYESNGFWNCLCDCGNKILVKTSKLKRGHTKSCGCLKIEICLRKLHNNVIKKRLKRGIPASTPLTPLNKTLRNKAKDAKKYILNFYKGKCILCSSSLDIQVHHIIPLSVAPDLSASIDNLAPLCNKCHKKVHRGSNKTDTCPDITNKILEIKKLERTI